MEDSGIEDISEPRQTPGGGTCSDDNGVLQENIHLVKETIDQSGKLIVPDLKGLNPQEEGDELIPNDDQCDNS